MMVRERTCSLSECYTNHYAKGYCNKHYQKWKKYGDAVSGGTWYSTPEEAFAARTIPVTETGCLLWTGALYPKGYGCIKVNGVNTGAHIFAWEQEHGKVPSGYMVDHKCHTPACCNVGHLRLATRAQNNSNLSGIRVNNTSGYRNVTWNKDTDKWHVSITKNGVRHYFGLYEDLEESASVAEEKRIELFGEFAGKGV